MTVIPLPSRSRPTEVVVTTGRMQQLTGEPFTVIDGWARAGLIRQAQGTGTVRVFPVDEVRVVVMARRLVDGGFTDPAAFRVARDLIAERAVKLADGVYLIGRVEGA
jgi:hypothetical protein